MKPKTYYTLTIDGKEMVKSPLLSEVTLRTPNVEDEYKIAKHVNGEVVNVWGFLVDPETGRKKAYASHKGKKIKPSPIPDSMKKTVLKINCCGKKIAGAISTLKREYKARKNLKLLEKKVEFFDL